MLCAEPDVMQVSVNGSFLERTLYDTTSCIKSTSVKGVRQHYKRICYPPTAKAALTKEYIMRGHSDGRAAFWPLFSLQVCQLFGSLFAAHAQGVLNTTDCS